MKVYCIVAFFFLLAIDSFAQTTTPPNLIPPSPNAYAFAKYGDVPVSLSTGIPSISIPLYNVTDHEISVDISLSYYAGGIKVDEEASSAGLGWSLNAGGSITRIVRGRPDDLVNGVFQPRTNITVEQPPANSTLPTFFTQNGLESASHDGSDNGPDQFIFNFNGRTGKFSFDRNGNAVLLKKEDLDIKWQQGATGYGLEFIIKDEKGLVYKFSQSETSYFPSISAQAITSWYLTSIVSPSGNSINFEYAGYSAYHYSNNSAPVFLLKTNANTAGMIGSGTPSDPAYNNLSQSESYISKISSSTSTVEFGYSNQARLDANGNAGPLSEIRVYNTVHGLIKKIKFNTSYFEANNAHRYPSALAKFQHLNKRLRLDAVQEYSADGVTPAAPPYQFTYLGDNDPTTDDKYTLPVRLSAQQDHWGYYNYSQNEFLHPGGSELLISPIELGSYAPSIEGSMVVTITNGANREPDTAAMKAGMIQRITYPTGGHTDFNFESNYSALYKEGGVRVKTIKIYPVTGLPIQKNYTYVGYSNSDPKKSYFEGYVVYYQGIDGSPSEPHFETVPLHPVLGVLGVPYDIYSVSHEEYERWVKVSAQSQQILGAGSNPGYDVVTVAEPGNGFTVTTFDNSAYSDYNGDESYSENSSAELNLLTGLYQSTIARNELPYPYSDYINYVENFNTTWRNWPYVPIFDNSWKRGAETSRVYYRENGTPIKSESFVHTRKLLKVLPGFMVYKFDQAINSYFWSTYGVPGGQTILTSKTETVFDANGQNPVNETTNYFYDSPDHMQATRIEKVGSDGKKDVLLTTYPLDYATGTTFLDNMKTAHLVAYPVEKVNFIDDGVAKRITSGNLSYYLGANGLTDQVKSLKMTGNLAASAYKFSNRALGQVLPVATPGAFVPDTRYEPRLSFANYDTEGNPGTIARTDGVPTIYIWGYSGNYPVAEIKNATYTTVETALGGSAAVANFRDLSSPSDATVENFLAPLRTATSLKDALVTNYTYNQLIGMTSARDAKGEATYYEYDKNNRLRFIKNKDRDIIKAFCYNYQGQAVDCYIPQYVPTQQLIYARLEAIDGGQDSGGDSQDSYIIKYDDVYIRFYSDAACTQPAFIVDAMTVRMTTTQNHQSDFDSGITTSNDDFIVAPGVTFFHVGLRTTHYNEVYTDGDGNSHYQTNDYSYEVAARAGSNYQPVAFH